MEETQPSKIHDVTNVEQLNITSFINSQETPSRAVQTKADHSSSHSSSSCRSNL